MRVITTFGLLFLIIANVCKCYGKDRDFDTMKWPTVGISVLVRNKAHTLPYFLSCLMGLDYPKDRLYIWMISDFNQDNSINILEEWAKKYGDDYNGVFILSNTTTGPLQRDQERPNQWTPEHFEHVIRLRERALEYARKTWADYILMIDADVFLTYPLALKELVKKDLPIVAPMLISDGLYSNFWCGMTENYYYRRTEDYNLILKQEKIGCFSVPMVHMAVLVSLKNQNSERLTYDPKKIIDYEGPIDDIIAFAMNAKKIGIPIYICNDKTYGFVTVPLDDDEMPEKDKNHIVNIKLEALSKGISIPLDSFFRGKVEFPEYTTYGCDAIYMINLERRSERRLLMELSFKELGMAVTWFRAIDGREMHGSFLRELDVELMPGYEDPYHKRPMKAGEIGCFLSHYSIWEEIVQKHYEKTIILEDDIHFTPYFRQKFERLMDEVKNEEWDLLYLGRKILMEENEENVTKHTTKPLYSYWTLGYVITEKGAQKLIDADPLSKLLPVDEFLPIMFDQHPNEMWKAYFPNRNIIALSAAPLLIHPTHYTGQQGYISDTEDSTILKTQTSPRTDL